MTQNQNSLKPLVSIIILNYNAGKLLLECVESVFNTNYTNFEVLVIDNASSDNSHKICKEKFERIYLIENKTNLGYCEGNNVGVQKASGEFIVILNPDTVVDSNWLNDLIVAYYIYGDGIYQPKFLTTTDHKILMSTGNMIQLFGFGFSRGKGQVDTKQFEKIEKIGYASGTCIFTTKKIFLKIGMFDPFLFAYHDDLDLCWRAILQGINSYYVPKSIVYHPPEGFSFKWSSFKYYLLERNRLYCILTNYSRTTFYKMLPALILVEIAIIIFYLKKRMLNEKLKSYFDIIKNRKKIRKRYHMIQKNRIVSDKEIIKNFSNEIYVPSQVTNKESNKLFNNFIGNLSRLVKHFV